MKIIRVFFKLVRMNIQLLTVYRTSFFISFVLMAFWMMAFVLLITVIFLHTETLAGWGKGEVLLMLAFYYLLQNISDIFFKDNFERFGLVIRKGEFDFRLSKPVSPRLLSFFYIMRFDHTAGLIVTSALFWHALRQINPSVSFGAFMTGLLYSILASVLYFQLLSFIATLAFFISKNDTFNVLIWNLSQISRYPRQIYQAFIGKIFTFIIPFALLAALPAEIVVQFNNGYLPLIFLAITLIISIASHIFWKFGIRRYSSAS